MLQNRTGQTNLGVMPSKNHNIYLSSLSSERNTPHSTLPASSDESEIMVSERSRSRSRSTSTSSRHAFHRPIDAHSGSGLPLLEKNDDKDRGRPQRFDSPSTSVVPPAIDSTSTVRPPRLRHSSTVPSSRSRSRSLPNAQDPSAARQRYLLAAIFLVVCLVSFVLQTELGRYVQHELGWNKAYCMLYLTHGSWSLLWPAQLLFLRLRNRHIPWSTFWRRHVETLRSTAHMVAEQNLDIPRHVMRSSPVPYMLRTTAFVTCCLTMAGLTWYVAVNMTSPSDLTAIYNCSAFFAYAFSVPILQEKLRLDKSLAVLVAIIGVLIVAYGDSAPEAEADPSSVGNRFLGNLIIGAGSILYGLYEVLYKRYACPPSGTSATHGILFANTFGSCIGLFTLLVLWIPLPVLHILGWETFALPTGQTAVYLWISVLMNATFAGSFLVLISLTSPVLSSVAALLTIFIVAVADWLLTGQGLSFSAMLGGALIVLAFAVLSWSTWTEITDDESGYREAPVDWDSHDEDEDEVDDR